jgi:predicted Fe-Mo cluster-binding NifX family protein
MEFETFENPSEQIPGSDAIGAVQSIAGRNAKVVIADVIGLKAYQILSAAGIRVLMGIRGQIREIIDAYRTGNLQARPQFTPPWNFHRGRRRRVST